MREKIFRDYTLRVAEGVYTYW